MAEIKHNQVDAYLKKLKGVPFHPVYLIFGEELLFKTAFNTLLDSILPGSKRMFNYHPIDEADGSIPQAIEHISTYSLQPGAKVVGLLDSRVFHSRQNEAKLLEKAKEAFDTEDHKKAAKLYASLLGRLNLSFEDLQTPEGIRKLKTDDKRWIETLNAYCLDNDLSIPADDDSAAVLEGAIRKGFPKGNHLIITAEIIDKRKRLYKTILNHGVVLDCSVPKGDRREDRIEQEAVLKEKMESILKKGRTTIEANAVHAVMEKTGFDLRVFCQDMETLVSYVGERRHITVEDVEAVLQRTKRDPIYELTNAVAERNAQQALFIFGSLLSESIHPLQVLAAITNQIRKLLLAKGFFENSQATASQSRISYQDFRNSVMPQVETHDAKLLDRLGSWDAMLNAESAAQEAHGKKKNRKPHTDLLVARNPHNAYPVFQTLLKSNSYTKNELMHALIILSEADIRLKTTGQNPKFVIEAAIVEICSPEEKEAHRRVKEQ